MAADFTKLRIGVMLRADEEKDAREVGPIAGGRPSHFPSMAMQELAEDFWTTKAEAVVGFLLVQDTATTRMNSTSDLFWQHAVNFWHLNVATRNQKKEA